MDVSQATIDALEGVLEERLEVDIIAQLAQRLDLDAQSAMTLYYNSRLAQQINDGAFGIQFLDATALVEDLLENEL